MSAFDPQEEAWEDDTPAARWPLHWQGLYPRERRLWFESGLKWCCEAGTIVRIQVEDLT